MTFEHPARFPPPLSRSKVVDGKRVPIMEAPTVECGQKVELRGIGWVVCIREAGHPVYIDWGHNNGYVEWAFDADSGTPN